MTIAEFKITTPRAGYTGEGAGGVFFRSGEAVLVVDLDDWSQGNARGPLSYFRSQGFGIEPLSGVTVDRALADPAAEASALLAERDELQRQLDAENARRDVEGLREKVERLRAERAAQEAEDAGVEPTGAGKEGVGDDLRHDIVPPAPDAPVSDWRAYAVEVDPRLDDRAAKTLDKATLIEQYGSAYRAQEDRVTA